MDKKTGLFICSGCGIGDCINTLELKDAITPEFNPVVCENFHSLCSNDGLSLIKSAIAQHSLDSLVIAACSPRFKQEQFTFSDTIQIERVNLREQVAWCQEPQAEDTQMLAEDMLRMGITKVAKTSIPKPYIAEDLSSVVLIVGGGVSGLTAAAAGAAAGYEVVLIEKEEKPGGWGKLLYKQLPYKPPYKEPVKPVIEDKINTVINNELIDIRTCTTIKSISGEPGRFSVTLLHSGSTDVIQVGSIVLATGWQPYDASRIAKFGYDQFKNVVTSIELEEMAKKGSLLRPSDQKPAESVLFIQCAGSRDQEHLPYCSSFCCGTTLKQATYIREFNRNANIFVIYKDIRMPGHYEQFYQEVQKDEQLFMTKGEVSGISENGEQLLVEVENTLIGEKVQIKVDLVVLAVGMTPSNSEDLNLEYRQGKGLPGLKYDFADSHFICFPYETRRTGIYAAGAVRAPMDISASITDAGGAMLKAIQTIESVKRGDKVHPRSGDQSYPQLYMERCTDCKRCTEECPFGAYDETEKGTPLPNPNRCRSCGICLGSCPERIINFDDFSIDSVSSMIKSVFIPDEFEEKPRILLFLCENDAYPAFDMAGLKRLKYSPYIRIIPVRCIGSVNKIWITDALNHGYDGILQIGCKPGDDYQCHFIQGSELSKTRAVNFQETLETMMLEPERVQTEFIEINEFNRVPEIINDYVELIEEIGPNPFKGL